MLKNLEGTIKVSTFAPAFGNEAATGQRPGQASSRGGTLETTGKFAAGEIFFLKKNLVSSKIRRSFAELFRGERKKAGRRPEAAHSTLKRFAITNEVVQEKRRKASPFGVDA